MSRELACEKDACSDADHASVKHSHLLDTVQLSWTRLCFHLHALPCQNCIGCWLPLLMPLQRCLTHCCWINNCEAFILTSGCCCSVAACLLLCLCQVSLALSNESDGGTNVGALALVDNNSTQDALCEALHVHICSTRNMNISSDLPPRAATVPRQGRKNAAAADLPALSDSTTTMGSPLATCVGVGVSQYSRGGNSVCALVLDQQLLC